MPDLMKEEEERLYSRGLSREAVGSKLIEAAARRFVAIVETERARSEKTYTDLKYALALLDGEELEDCAGCAGIECVFEVPMKGRVCINCHRKAFPR